MDDGLDPRDQNTIRERVRAGFAAIERGEYTEYVGRQGLARLADEIKARAPKRSAEKKRRRSQR